MPLTIVLGYKKINLLDIQNIAQLDDLSKQDRALIAQKMVETFTLKEMLKVIEHLVKLNFSSNKQNPIENFLADLLVAYIGKYDGTNLLIRFSNFFSYSKSTLETEFPSFIPDPMQNLQFSLQTTAVLHTLKELAKKRAQNTDTRFDCTLAESIAQKVLVPILRAKCSLRVTEESFSRFIDNQELHRKLLENNLNIERAEYVWEINNEISTLQELLTAQNDEKIKMRVQAVMNQIIKLREEGKEHLSDLLYAIKDTTALLSNRMTPEKYKERALSYQGKGSENLRWVGKLMMGLGAYIIALSAVIVFTGGVGVTMGVASGALLAAGGLGFFAASGHKGLAKEMITVANAKIASIAP
ncbi:Uncharacterised protein (plasmid) [Legionella adelaidensis]|uniref:VipE n=1 Tax=Legionella adelaidensis TaxID=45056 RepID=A0A0W0R0K7_9GAMM|nr:hypothetical protein [Legionella adelaidensis]KTC64594.1 hypothetical protein Lade_1888 [Legionella adelaidensis]VEH85962.1 Uncharacterised protein [Legionella adelaidensis]